MFLNKSSVQYTLKISYYQSEAYKLYLLAQYPIYWLNYLAITSSIKNFTNLWFQITLTSFWGPIQCPNVRRNTQYERRSTIMFHCILPKSFQKFGIILTVCNFAFLIDISSNPNNDNACLRGKYLVIKYFFFFGNDIPRFNWKMRFGNTNKIRSNICTYIVTITRRHKWD